MENFIKYLNDNNIKYFDWNASAGDAEGKNLSAEDMIENILKDVRKAELSVVLCMIRMHMELQLICSRS